MADYDFITTCNWTSTGTYTLRAFRGAVTNVVTTHYASIFYRKVGAGSWTALNSSGQMVVDSTGEWEIGNDWNKSGNDVLTHSYYGITDIDSCTAVTFDTVALGTTVGNFFLYSVWDGCTSLSSMPSGFNLPTGLTTVGTYFLAYTFRNCTSLSSMPSGFNLPTGITTVGTFFLLFAWDGCTSLSSMPSGFDIPTGLTTVGSNFLLYTWNNCTALKNDGDYTEPISFNFSATDVFGGTCPIEPDSVTYVDTTIEVEVNRLKAEATGNAIMFACNF